VCKAHQREQTLVLKFKKRYKQLFFYLLVVPLGHLFLVLEFSLEFYVIYFCCLFLSAFLLYKFSSFVSNYFLFLSLPFYMIISYFFTEISDYIYDLSLDFDLESLNYHSEPTIMTFLTLMHLFILFLLGYNSHT